MAGKGILESLENPAPCNAEWAEMVGNDVRRFCAGCQKDVYNLSAMTRVKAARFVMDNRGKACIRFARFRDGRVITSEASLHQISRRSRSVAAAVLATSLSLSTAPVSQAEALQKRVRIDQTLNLPSKNSAISFIVVDPAGQPIPDSEVILSEEKTKRQFFAKTDANGLASFHQLRKGLYKLAVSAQHFQPYKWQVQIQALVEPRVTIRLEIAVVTGVIGFPETDVPIFEAILAGEDTVVRKSISSGFGVNAKDSFGNTALHFAVKAGNLGLIKFLLERGSRINTKRKDGRTPILMILENENYNTQTTTEILTLLIGRGANVNVRYEDKLTLLMWACKDGHSDIARILLESKANPNLKDSDGETAYQKTASEEIKQLLLKHGARRN